MKKQAQIKNTKILFELLSPSSYYLHIFFCFLCQKNSKTFC